MGSGVESHAERARPLGTWLAGLGVHLLTGGGAGVMTEVSRAFHRVEPRQGLVIGVLPGSDGGARRVTPEGYPNEWVELPIVTHLPSLGAAGESRSSRNPINILSSDLVVALPGGAGTASEVRLALRYGKPLVVFAGGREAIPDLPEEIRPIDDFGQVRRLVTSSLGLDG